MSLAYSLWNSPFYQVISPSFILQQMSNLGLTHNHAIIHSSSSILFHFIWSRLLSSCCFSWFTQSPVLWDCLSFASAHWPAQYAWHCSLRFNPSCQPFVCRVLRWSSSRFLQPKPPILQTASLLLRFRISFIDLGYGWRINFTLLKSFWKW